MAARVVARWESRGGAHCCELVHRGDNFYVARGDGITLHRYCDSDAAAIAEVEPMTLAGSGMFAPDDARTDMRRVV